MFKKEKVIKIVDMHCHILPQVDDGAKNFEESLKMAKTAVSNGVKAIIVTPHFKEYKRIIPKQEILDRINQLKALLRENDVSLDIYPGNEIMRYEAFSEGDVSNVFDLNGSSYYLVEFKPSDSYSFIYRYLDNLTRNDISPILAHIERYDEINTIEKVKEIKDLGVLIQVNYKTIKEDKSFNSFIKKLLKNKLIDFVSSDAHDDDERSYNIKECVSYLYRKYDETYVDDIVYQNAIDYLGVNEE